MANSTWDESLHPRDDEGKFTYKNGTSSHNSIKDRIEKQNKEREEFERRAEILYKNMKVKNKNETFEEYTPLTNHINTKLGGDIKGLLIDAKSDACTKRSASNFNKYSSRANHIGMYSDRDNEQQCTKDVNEKETGNKRNYDQNFNEAIEIIFQNEGGFSDNKNDFGGRTNMGITQKTYDDYCKRHGMNVRDVKKITKEEAKEIYYNDYWKPSGADKVKDSVGATILFDTAVLHGVGRAKQFYKESGDNFEKMIELRNKHYDNLVKNILRRNKT